MEQTLSGFPSAMIAANDKLYLFFKGALQVVQFYEPDVPTTQSVETTWEIPSAAVSDGTFAYITAKNGIFQLKLDDTLAITQINKENWGSTRALGVYGEYLYAVINIIYKVRISDGSYNEYNTENWEHMICGACYEGYLFMPSDAGQGALYRYDMTNNMYKSISEGWYNSKTATMFDKKSIFIITDTTWFVDSENGSYKAGNHDKWKSAKMCVASIKDHIYVATDARRLYKLDLDGGYKIVMTWSEPKEAL